jgi:hypothetical protein
MSLSISKPDHIVSACKTSSATLAHHYSSHGYRTHWQEYAVNFHNVFGCSLMSTMGNTKVAFLCLLCYVLVNSSVL